MGHNQQVAYLKLLSKLMLFSLIIFPCNQYYKKVVLNSELCTGATDGFYPFPGQECTNDYYACVNGIQYNKVCIDLNFKHYLFNKAINET